ncbi:asparagine synthase (glutamine-hydrolyzing) [Phytohabitans sp. ZYX-F-186]|uniref:asparagine synthase (glutamine-hydrolyzing) n=1 Tax=Phytohabitans maris TaxID=3071409 RepID=A0ABU0ZB33_9ACTN|nr:asparagine synthase (glutamine-hydrolyzing) [Phytohabitans sp. ZYX-F-186]MDQ7904271.1 asparagine synthase (glutamine-hydrolyzing) [Phytohabitans sp. ZYX-F-186]
MCGILAFFSSRGDAGAHRDAVAGALECLHHRGPDETGIDVVDGDVVFAHKRLSIIDVESSHEPLSYANDRYLLTFNGEIYNYLELREELIRECGAIFATQGDAEVVVAGYHHWGEQVLTRLRGMFAFVIWDRLARRAFGARDYFGIKPMYYMDTTDGLFLASEKKALLELAGPLPVDGASLSHYLTLQYVPEPRTLHEGIQRIGSGELLRWTPLDGVEVERWFRPVFQPAPVDDEQKVFDRIRDTLRDSVRVHMRADVPVGAFLSSGIDSTAIVALAREFNPNILTFTVGFDVDGYSEIGVAQDSARHLGVTTIPTVIGPQDMMDALPKIVWHLDDPVADPSLVPLYFVAKKAAEHVTVVLSGEGSDEFFGGYTIYREPLSLNSIQRLPHPLQRGLRAMSRVIPRGVKGKSFLERGTTRIEDRYYGNARMFAEVEKRVLMRRNDGSVRYTDVTAPIYAECTDLDDVTKMQYVDLHTWLRGDILVKADRISMAHSLEVRVPFLDKDVFEVASTLPVGLKLPPRSNATKYALRRALDGVVPPPIVNRRKLGFPTPTRVWLRGEMYEWARHILATSGAGELLDLGYAEDLLEDHRRGEADHSRKVWTVLVFCVWYGVFVDGTIDPGIERNQSALLTKPPLSSPVA